MIQVGQRVWLPCEVKPGPFSDERLVRISSNLQEDWVGFVPTWSLRDQIEEGETYTKALVIEVQGGTFSARISGHPVTHGPFSGKVSHLKHLGSLEA